MSRRRITRREFVRGAIGTGVGLAASSAVLPTLVGCKPAAKKVPLRVVSYLPW